MPEGRPRVTRLLSAVLVDFGDSVGFHCPGCDYVHVVSVTASSRPNWSYNGNPDAPTFSPSVLIRTGRAVNPSFVPEPGDPPEVCHSFVVDGQIQFLTDCTHPLVGQTVPLPPYPHN